ncbi:hypothetical protein IKF92_03460 [Candidatus Saccharibacteria bacterium]|nr:hypothetical protein [Candidatus Saccharibacteria bacterium]
MSKSKNNNNVAIIFDDLTEFFVMRPAIDDMKKAKINVDIIVPYDSGYNGLSEYTFKEIVKLGYHPLKDAPKDKEYKVLLTPYPTLEIIKRTKYIYHLRYSYGPMSAKPDPVFLPEWKIYYDGIFSFNSYEPHFLSAYGNKYHLLPYWKYNNFKKTTKSKTKPNLLILSTFGTDISNVKLFTKSAIQEIKKHYHIIVKAHHATHFNSDQDDSLSILQDIADDFYDSSTPLIDLLEIADVVLSDNSGAIFESIYAGIPVAIFCKNPNQRKLGKINTLQYELIQQKVLPYTDRADQVLPLLQSIQPYSEKQKKIKWQLFPKFKDNSPKEFTKVIKEYLATDQDSDYYKAIHDLLVDEVDTLQNAIKTHETRVHELEDTVNKQSLTIQELNNAIDNLKQSTSWKITKPLRQLKQIGKKERS